MNAPAIDPEHCRLGNYVLTTTNDHKGRIAAIYEIFADTPENNYWFRRQVPAYDKAALLERWILILCDKDGSVLVPESNVTVIEKFDFYNPYAEKRFID